MIKRIRLDANTLVLICDARRALFLRNVGTVTKVNFIVELDLAASDSVSQQDSDRAGRRADHIAAGRPRGPRSAMEQPDRKHLDAEQFAGEICANLEEKTRAERTRSVVIAGPPEMLGLLRAQLPKSLKSLIVAEIGKDLTKMPIDRIATSIAEYWGTA